MFVVKETCFSENYAAHCVPLALLNLNRKFAISPGAGPVYTHTYVYSDLIRFSIIPRERITKVS